MDKLKESTRWLSDAVETACGWALLAVGFYALFFIDLTGNGSAWNALRGVARDAAPIMGLAVLPNEGNAGSDRILIASERRDEPAPAAAAVPSRPPAAMTDAPAELDAKGDWKTHLTGQLRSFVIYGQGEQTASASASVGPAPSASAKATAPTASVPGSAYRAGATGTARPGIGARVSRVASGPADSVRNISGR